MPIKRVYIKNSAGQEIAQLGGRLIKIAPRGNIKATPQNTGVVLSYVPDPDMLDAGYKRLKLNPYVTSINGSSPLNDGSFWINTDRCMSWTNAKSTIILWDACPACYSCDTHLVVRRRYEWLRVQLNDLKDVNLYDNATKESRNKYFESRLTGWQSGCKVSAPEKPQYLNSYRLLLNYMTMVHMWNFVVSQNNTSTVIRAAAEDASGFYIQTKRAVPSCNNTANICCEITISARDVQEGVSVLVARKRTEFKPFEGSGVMSSDIEVIEEGTTTKKFKTTFAPVAIAGTYIVEVKIMPFMYVEIKKPDGTLIDFSKVSWNVEEPSDQTNIGEDAETEFSSTRYDLGQCTIKPGVLESPTVTDYNSSKAFPARALEGRNIWDIKLKWTLTGELGGEEGKSEEEDYVYATTKVRVPVNGLLRSSDWIELDSATYE